MDKKADVKQSIQNIHRNKVERKRQTLLDEEIQKLLCFLPKNIYFPRKMSRGAILVGIYNVAMEKMDEEKIKPKSQASENSSKTS